MVPNACLFNGKLLLKVAQKGGIVPVLKSIPLVLGMKKEVKTRKTVTLSHFCHAFWHTFRDIVSTNYVILG